MQTVRVDRWNATNYTVHACTRDSELVEMIFEKVYSASTQEIQTKWNHSFELSINALHWSDSFSLDLFHKFRMYYSFDCHRSHLCNLT